MLKPKIVNNVVFDLGGVLFNLSEQATLDAFEKNGVKNVNEKYKKMIESEWFRDFEIGTIPPEEFRNHMRKLMEIDLSDEVFDSCWNAMITSYPPINRAFLRRIAEKNNLYVLSNTNVIHVKYFEPIANWPSYLFKKRYYSNEIHFRKPDLECFNFVVNDAKITPEDTVLLDDRIDNIENAKKAGWNAIHVKEQSALYRIFNYDTK